MGHVEEIEYLRRRRDEERQAAKTAADPCARNAHELMAMEYDHKVLALKTNVA